MVQPRKLSESILDLGGARAAQPPFELAKVDCRASNGCLAHDAPRSLIPWGAKQINRRVRRPDVALKRRLAHFVRGAHAEQAQA